MSDDRDDRPTSQVERLHAELLAELESLPTDVIERGDVLAYMIALSTELRIRSEREIGRLLLSMPDSGGRSSPCGKGHPTRSVRELLGLDRTASMWIRKLGELDDRTIESVIDGVWSDHSYPLPLTAGSVIRALGKPPPSMDPG